MLSFAYDNPNSQIIYPEIYAAYNKLFYDYIKDELNINQLFEQSKNTAFWEQYTLNTFQFSAAKSRAEMKLMQDSVFDSEGNKKSFSQFKKDVSNIVSQFNQTWLRTEYDLAVRGSVMINKWNNIWNDRDIMPYAIYRTRRDKRVREEHAKLDGLKFKIDGANAKKMFTPNGFGCRCTWDTTDEPDGLINDKEVGEWLKKEVAPEFQNNVAIDGIFPSAAHSYFDALPSVNSANSNMFGGTSTGENALNTTFYKDSAVKLAVNEWKSDDHKDVIFKNREFSLNVILTADTLKKISKKSKGFENIKRTVEKPDEIWGKGADVENQKEVIINYFAHDNKKNSYIVTTKGGYIIDAYYRSHNDSKQLRMQGVKFIK